MDEIEESIEIEETIDDTVELLHGNAAMSLPKVFEMGLLGGFSTNGFDKSADLVWTWVVFALFASCMYTATQSTLSVARLAFFLAARGMPQAISCVERVCVLALPPLSFSMLQ